MAYNRDNQRERVYRAERATFPMCWDMNRQGEEMRKLFELNSKAEATRFVRDVCSSKLYRELTPKIQKPVERMRREANPHFATSRNDVRIIDARGKRSYMIEGEWVRREWGGKSYLHPAIHMTKQGLRNKHTLLHELCHWAGTDRAGHGPQFAFALEEMTRKLWGNDLADTLLAKYDEFGVESAW